MWQSGFDNHKYIVTKDNERSYFDAETKDIILRSDSPVEVILHETAHAIDRDAINVKIDKYLTIKNASSYVEHLVGWQKEEQDLEMFAKTIGVKTEDGWFVSGEPVFEKYNSFMKDIVNEYGYKGDEEDLKSLSDVFSGITQDQNGGSFRWGGHDKDYWLRSVTRGEAPMSYQEAWADYCSLKVMNSKNALKILNETLPNLSSALEKTYKEVFD